MSIVDSPDFNVWLDAEFQIDREAEPTGFGCTACAASPKLYPFIGSYCVVCLAVSYGRFLKAQDIAMWIEQHSWIWAPGEINEKASAIALLGTDRRILYANETDEEAEARWRAEDAKRAAGRS